MNTLMKTLRTLALAGLLPVTLLMVPPAALAAFSGPGTATLSSGKSTLSFASQFIYQFPALGATVNSYGQAKLKGNFNNKNIRVLLPLAYANLNLVRGQKIPFYDFAHKGGFSMVQDTGDLVILFNNPSLRTSAACLTPSTQCLELGATFIVNGEVYDDIPNFAQTAYLDTAFEITSSNKITLNDINLFLTDAGAAAMNFFFKLSPTGDIYFTKGYPFGTLEINGAGARVICPPNLSYSKRREQCQ